MRNIESIGGFKVRDYMCFQFAWIRLALKQERRCQRLKVAATEHEDIGKERKHKN